MTSSGGTVRGGDRPAQPETNASNSRRVRKKLKKFRLFSIGAGLDIPLCALIIVLLSIGIVMMFSASFAYCYYNYGDSYFYLKRQAMFAIAGLIIMFLISTFDYHRFHKLAFPIMGITILMLVVLVAFSGTAIAPEKNGAARWLNLGPLEFQPSEIAKFALIVMFAHMISQRGDKMGTFKQGFLPFIGILGVLVVLIVPQPHLSATIIVLLIGLIMMFVGGTKLRYMIGLALIGVAALIVAILFSDSLAEKFAYAPERVQGWLDPFSEDNWNATWQTRQSLYAIGSGQLLGVGLGQSRQKYLYLPEPQNDFIFAIVCEELGFVGAVIIIILFALLIWRGVYVALHARDRFGTMLGLGIIFQIGIQIVLNICVVTNTIPNTGIGLPFFSSGGTALIIILAEMGVLLQISRSSNIEKV